MDDPASLSFLLFFADSSTVVEWPTTGWSVFGILSVVLLVLANGFFVASEFALVAVRKSRIEALAAEGNRAAIRLVGILTNANAYISATQLGITLSSLALGWIGGPAVSSLLEPILLQAAAATGFAFLASVAFLQTISFLIAFSLITFVQFVLGEIVPKTAALELSERVSLLVSAPLSIFYNVFYYPIRLLDWAGTRTVRLFGLRPSSEHGAGYTEDEIRQLIRVSQASGQLNADEHRLIDQVFEFSETTVKEAMIPRTEIVAVTHDCSLEQVAEAFRTHGFSRLPIYKDSLDDIVGIVHVKDVLNALIDKPDFSVADLIQKPNYVVDTARLEDVLRQMQQEKFHFGFVVDEHGGIEGIITLEDLLEEIVGEISDEHDEEVNEQIHEQSDGSFILDGATAVRDLNKRLDLNLPISEGYTTVAGFLMSESGQILGEGDVVPYNGHTFHIEKAEKRRILTVRMEKTERPAAATEA